MNELDDFFDFNLDDFDLHETASETRIHKPKIQPKRNTKTILYKNAEKLVDDIDFKQNDRIYVIVDGSFIFGDFIEAFIVKNNILCKELTISTLSLSEGNIISLENILVGGFIEKLNLIVSDYFYSHERNSLIKQIYNKLDVDNKFQLAVAGTHCKLVMIETLGGKKITIHGSANLRSSDSLEQFTIEDNADFYDFNMLVQNRILDKYKTINKSIRSQKLKNVIHGKET